MKKFLCCITALVLICCVMCGCGNTEKTSNETAVSKTETATFSASMCEIAILDYNTESVITQFEASDDAKTNTVLNTVNNTEDTTEKPKTEPSYIIHLVDKGNSQYDVWYLVYIDDTKLFVCLDSSKTNSHNLELPNGVRLCTSTTAEEFKEILNS